MLQSHGVELLSPAGDLERLKIAVAYGADAIYVGGKQFGMRAGANNFTNEELKEGLAYTRAHGVKLFVTCNITPTDVEVEAIPEFFRFLEEIGIDGVIVGDIGVMGLAQEHCPSIDIHMSTQVGITNYAAANQLYKLGAKRVVLARELSIEQIRNIRDNTPPDLEIEAFVHGAMCMAFSGRCLISQYMQKRDANRGECSQPCRWGYHLVEEKRPNEKYDIIENEKGTYIMNSKDMCMIEHIDKLVEAGITSFKLEGRGKANYYVAVVTNAYRHAMDLYLKNPDSFSCPQWLAEEVTKVSHRHYTTGFYFGEPVEGQYYDNGGYLRTYTVVAETEGYEDGYILCTEKNKFILGEEVEVLEPNQVPFTFTITEMLNENNEPITEAIHPLMKVKIKCEQPVGPLGFIRVAREK